MLTMPQTRARTKWVTRRLGWCDAEPGQTVLAVEKCQGIKRGQQVEILGPILFVAVRREPLHRIDFEDCCAEGFPHLSPTCFVDMFCKHMKCTPATVVTRIEFRWEP